MTAERCTGHCCREFALPLWPAELWASFRRLITGRDQTHQDIGLIAPMVRFLRADDRNPYTGEQLDYQIPIYTCQHLRDDGDCAIYEHRPAMCFNYPYEGRCRHPGCTARGDRVAGGLV